jgi:hypothetical protein
MTYSLNTRAPALAGLAATIAAVLAVSAGAALSQDPRPAPTPPRTAVLAGADATATDIADATALAYRDGATQILVRNTGGLLEAEAQAAVLAAQGFDRVVPAGAQARTAVGQATASELSGTSAW